MTRTTADVLRYFDERLDAYGPCVQAVDWVSAASQTVRFRVLAGIGRLDGATVLDVGSGLGDLAGFLAEHHPTARYEGCDVNPRMVELARARFPGARFFIGDPLTGDAEGAWDWILASGLPPAGRGVPPRDGSDALRAGAPRRRVQPALGVGAGAATRSVLRRPRAPSTPAVR